MKRQQKPNTTATWVLLILALLVIGALISKNSQKDRATIQNGHITRTCEQLLKFLDQEPEDITTQPYVANIPKQIQQDIDQMLNAEEDLDIIYTADGKEVIRIQKADEETSGIIVIVQRLDEYYYSGLEKYFSSNFSFYRNGDYIVVYGSNAQNRRLDWIAINAKTGFYSWGDIVRAEYIDLFGTNIEYQGIRPYTEDMTLILTDDQFVFYHDGQQVGEGIRLPRGSIEQLTYYYVLSDSGDLYYLYYCEDMETPWIRLIKIDEHVQIAEDRFVKGEENVKYQIYWKDGKRYAGISNVKLEKAYGQNFGHNENTLSQEELDFHIEVIELSKENVSKVVIQKQDVSSNTVSKCDWYLNYCYEVNDQLVYETQRIDGLDNSLYSRIPSGVLEKYEGMEISTEQVDEIIEELKQIYSEYENKDKIYEEEPPAGGSSAISIKAFYCFFNNI